MNTAIIDKMEFGTTFEEQKRGWIDFGDTPNEKAIAFMM